MPAREATSAGTPFSRMQRASTSRVDRTNDVGRYSVLPCGRIRIHWMPSLASAHRPAVANTRSSITAPVSPAGRPTTAAPPPPGRSHWQPRTARRARQLDSELLLGRRQPASCRALDLHPAMLAVWRDEQQVERARANAQARQQCRRGGASVLTIGNVQPDPVLPRGATQQVGDGTVHAPFDRRRRPAATTWERQRELVGCSHGEKTRGHLPLSGGAPRTNWVQKYNCFAIETTGRGAPELNHENTS